MSLQLCLLCLRNSPQSSVRESSGTSDSFIRDCSNSLPVPPQFDHLLGHLKVWCLRCCEWYRRCCRVMSSFLSWLTRTQALNPDIRGLTGKESNPIDPLNPHRSC